MQAMHHEPEQRVTPVFLCPQAESSGRHDLSRRFGNPDEGPKYVGELNAVTRLGAKPAIAPPQSLAKGGVCRGNAIWQGSTLHFGSRSPRGKCW